MPRERRSNEPPNDPANEDGAFAELLDEGRYGMFVGAQQDGARRVRPMTTLEKHGAASTPARVDDRARLRAPWSPRLAGHRGKPRGDELRS